MSIPHTGKLAALVNGSLVKFDGNRWTGAPTETVRLLNELTRETPTTHLSIREVAESVLSYSMMEYVIGEWESDSWTGEDANLPPWAID